MPRSDFKVVLGIRDRGATDALGALVKRSLLLKPDSPQGKVRLVCPSMRCALCSLQLWSETEADSANVAGMNWLLAHVE